MVYLVPVHLCKRLILQILQDYSAKEPRLCIVNRDNKGITKTLNEGIDLAQGEYIARMDADDISFPKRFEKQLKFLEEKKLDICGSQYEAFGRYYHAYMSARITEDNEKYLDQMAQERSKITWKKIIEVMDMLEADMN